MQPNIQITRELAQALMNYLSLQRYLDVFQLINELTRQASVKPEEKKEPTEEK